MSDSEDSIDIREMLELQMAEVEMLKSMFANPGEFTMDRQTVLDEFQAFLDGRIGYDCVEDRVGFTLRVRPQECAACQLEIVCRFPHKYPSVLPEVFIRVDAIDRENLRRLSDDLQEFLASLETGQIVIGSAVEWLQEKSHLYVKVDQKSTDKKTESQPVRRNEEASFTRMWIYSHHIYSKFKRRDIVDWATELDLKGFSMPGKPGVICVEGGTDSVDEFWYRIRRLNWKRLMIKEQEVKKLEGKSIAELCKFGKFQELDLDAQAGKGRNYHMNLGKFYEFLQQHDSAYIFQLYFGVEGKSVGD